MRRRICQHGSPGCRFVLGLAVFAAAGGFQSAFAQDVITFDNGDRLTGTITRLEHGELVLEVPFADGDLYVDWARVAVVDSQRVFQFQTSAGQRFLGRIQRETDPEAGTLVVEYAGVTQTYRRDDIVLVVQTVGELRGLLEVRASGGRSLSKSNDQKQFNASARVGYESPGYSVSVDASSIFSTQREGSNTNRHSTALIFTRNLRDRWGISLLNAYLSSEEQRLDLRSIVGGGPSRTFVRNGRIELVAVAGVVWNHERFDPEAGQEVNNELEGVGALNFSFYQFKQWELNSAALVFPSFTTGGRVRSSLRTNLRLRLVQGKPFWWNIDQTLDLDSDPPADAPGTDYVATTSISWEFP